MRIALVYKQLQESGGSEGQVHRLAGYLAGRGDDVHVFCARVRGPVPEGVTVHRMRSVLPLGRMTHMLAFSRWARRATAREEARRGRFDIKHAFGRSVGQDVYRLGGGCHRTYLEHAHALDRPPWLRPLLRAVPYHRLKLRLEDQALARAPFVITNSRMTRDDLLFRYDLIPERTAVVPNGVALDRFSADPPGDLAARRARLGVGEGDEVVLFLGSGYARKGLEPALRAIARLAADRPRLRLLVVGRDPDVAGWERCAVRLGVRERCVFLGPREDPEQLYPLADVYLLPTAYDPAANSTFEALACGVPVVTSEMNGASEILTEGVDGSVVTTPVHPDDVARALVYWLDHPDRRAVRAAARACAERYPADASAAAIREVYEQILAVRS